MMKCYHLAYTHIAWRPDGRLATQTINSDPAISYDYDDAGQLTTATDTPDGDWAWTYGTRGNPATTTHNNQVTAWATNPNGSVATATTAGVTTSYGYDPAGRRITATTATAVTTTGYDTAGRLAAIVTGDTIRARRYDAQGLIASITTTTPTATTVTAQISDTTMEAVSRTIATNDGDGWTHLVWGPAGPILAIGGGVYGAYQTDDLGSAIEDPTNSQIINGPTHYTPTGAADTAVADNQLGYRAEQSTAELTHLRNRDHDPTTTQFLTPDPLDGIDGTPTVANAYHYADNDPLNTTDPLGLRPGDGAINDGDVGAACESVGGRLVWWGDTGSKVCMEPPIGLDEGGSCWPPVTPGGDGLVYHQGGCGVWNYEIECARGDWIPGANFICQHSEGIIQGLTVIAVVALGVATGGAAVVAIGGSSGIAIGGGGGALALAGGGTVGGGAIVLSPTAAGALTGSVAGLGALIQMASSSNSGGGNNVPNRAHQQTQFEDAWRECQRQVGTLTRAQRRILHDAITKQGFGYHEILAECIDLFG
jgi:RHS repeat-associated protein